MEQFITLINWIKENPLITILIVSLILVFIDGLRQTIVSILKELKQVKTNG